MWKQQGGEPDVDDFKARKRIGMKKCNVDVENDQRTVPRFNFIPWA